ncbi:PREDICTED: hemicentin-1 isoform X1 [Crocodylus porosus]|uniref:hemicentin-1 isoform X1 n=1 Tax=Crocodylus porosus TaxID=8502 RepID=UPI0009396915|nr:PREDICTED: hemicentin-1 isoform X1 [Crocodylus porosus]
MISRENIPVWGVGFCIVFLLGLFSPCYAQDTRAEKEPSADEIPEGASTLAFVFDVTGSMYDDLVQVIEGASKILETSLKRPKKPLYNFALVPFHDPEIGPVTITTDPKKFQYELRELYVQGGGDCPEMSIGAIKIALEISLPGSFIYVFTDARSKDYRLTHEVLQLIQQKQSQVVFVLTGDCDDRAHIGYKVYEEIASTSSGQVFHLDKKQVNEVLKWVEEAVQASKVHLLSTDHLGMAVNNWQIPFDPSLKEVTVSLSGPSPVIEIRDPLGKQMTKGSGLNELLNIHNSAKVVNVKDPEPGMWTVKTSSSGRHSVRITGLSTIDFRAGFSRKPTLEFKKTSSRPVQGIPTYTLLNTTGIFLPARVDRLELLSITGDLLKTVPVKYYPDRKPYGIWNITDFIPPNEAFFVKITGYDKDDYLFQRVSSVSFSSIIPDAPKVVMPSKTPGYYLQPGSLTCHVESLIPFTQHFSRNGVKLGIDQFFKESSVVNWEFAKVTLSDEGYYECVAVSSAGTGRAQTFLDVSEPPPVIQVPNNVTVIPGERAILTCLTLSTVRYNLTWHRNGKDLKFLEPSRIRIMSNLSLEVKTVKLTDAGEYMCIAFNEGGSSAASVYLTVQEPPKVVISPKNQSFTTGSEVSIRCSATGYPKPTIVWTRNDMFIIGSNRYRFIPEGTLIIKRAISTDAGLYGCLASNSAGTERDTSTLTYIEGPKLTVVQSEILVALGDTTVMECKATGVPPPQVRWFKGDLELRVSAFLTIDTYRGLLKIQETQDLDAGDYTCMATNDAGIASGKITLDVGSSPVFTQEPSDESVDIGSNVTLPCYVHGYPEPKVKWRRLDGAPLFSRPFAISSISQLKTGALSITNLWVSDEGTYICEAENQFGKIQSQPATVTVTGLVAPLIGMSPAVANVIEGQQLTLPCVLLAGNPIPERRWIKNSMVLVPNPYINVRGDGSLHLERVRLQDAGDYTCMASNVAGTNNKTTTINVFVLPVIQHGQQIFSTIEGIPVTLPCKASGVPKPTIMWSKKGELIPISDTKFLAGSDGSLYIVSPGGEETGEYVCTATNAAGYATRKVQLTVYVKPRVSRPENQQEDAYDKPIEISVTAGEDVTLPCDVKSLPPPIITWAKEMQLISPFSPRHTFLPSGSMKIIETRVSDSGMYFCVATNIAGNATQSVKLNVHVPPKIQGAPRVMKVQVGHRIDIPCSAQGVPPPTVTWFKGRNTMLIDGRQYISSPDGTLTISKVQLSDSGIYKCVASNLVGSDESSITIQVQEPPTVDNIDPPYNTPFQERVANQRIAFPCPAKGTPKPAIKWLRNGKELTGNEPGISIAEDGTVLVIASVTPYDNGEYICVAVNEAGRTERKYNLKVHVPPEIQDQEKVTNASVIVNHPVSLFCEVSGTPFPTISWYKDDVQVMESSTLQILRNGKILKLLKAATDDAGQYSCKATNVAGSSEKLFNVDVLVPPTIKGADTPSEVSVILNHEISLECKVKGSPFPDIHWFKDGKPLFLGDPNVELVDRGQILRIRSARRIDKGRYQCSVANSAGKQVKEVKLIIHVPPTIKGGNTTTEISTLINSLIKLECETRGIPVPAITWYKDGHPIISSPQALYVDRGQFLQIPQAQVSDSAKYTCHVANIAGTSEKVYEVDVYVPPVIEGDSDTIQNKQVVAGNSLTLECKAAGNPPPLLTWLKDGVPVKASENLRILSRGKKLEILDAAETDRGQYVCVATSIAGEKKMKYDVEILVPPHVEGEEEPLDYIVILHSPLELDCLATGTPSPTIMWLKDGHPIEEGDDYKILLNGRKLLISRPQVSDTGRYKCVATNTAGDHEREFDVTVHVPPTIKSTGSSERSVVIYKPTTLQCIANGIPSPSITWLKDGQPVNTARGNIRLESSSRILQIAKALLEDAGKYTCVATNAAGEAQQHIRLHVHEPPYLENSGKMLNETVVMNNPIHLECKASGNPLPVITWYKDSHPLTSAAGVTFLNRGQILQIDVAQISDTGIYKCVALNTAGTAELFYSLQVHVPPSISGSNDMVAVVVNNLVRLECEARGIPAPILTWLKDGSPVSSFSGLQVLSGGRVLALTSAQISDTGKYTCVAVNAAGEKQRDIDLRVYVPPDITGEEQNVSVLISQAVELLCQSNAIPPPTLRWLKDGRPLLKKPGLSISEDGSVLKIEGAQVQDTGRYTCEATNVAGKTEKNYNVNVWVPPRIYGSDDLSQLTVIEGNLISLICESAGIPPPSLTWKKNGSPLLADSTERIRVLSGGRQLQISIAEKSDAAFYTCTASNIAGNTEKGYNLQVYVRPTILNSGSHPSRVVVIRGNDISLECKVQGIPWPAISWMKDGRPLVNGRGVEILSDGHLHLKNAQMSDTGRYVCVAVNVAGLTDKKYDLSVHVPPNIVGDLEVPENISIVEKNPVTLICEASGIPLPSITWLKNGWPITMNSSLRILSGGRSLRLTQSKVEDAGQYTCVVTNAAGEKRKHFDLSVIVPPGIVGENKMEDVKVKEKHSVTLACEVIGNPVPQITWVKDGQPLIEDDEHQILSSGRFLQITNAQVADTGRYTCIASNTAGDKSKSYSLNVLVSPTIAGADSNGNAEDVTVILNNPTSLVCEAYSYPPATITWLKDGAPLESNRSIRILPGGRTLQILNAQEDNAGKYTCIATNEAGETLKHYEVKVFIPPTINKGDISGMGLSPKEVKIKINNSLTLECEAHGIPAASISWYKDGQPLTPDAHITIQAGGRSLQIKEAQVSDTGRYTCVASNIAGEDEMEFDVNIQVPPSFRKLHGEWEPGNTVAIGRGGETKEVVLNNPLSLYCETNAVPPPVLTWYKDGYPLTSSDKVLILPGGRVLQIPRAQVEDAGRYTCVAVNEAGEDSIQYDVRVLLPPSINGMNGDLPEEVTVLVSKTIVLECVANGNPAPTITWQKDGQLLGEDDHHIFLSSGRILQILNSQITDTGRYVCVVENIAGSAKKYFNLNVHVPPSVVGTNPENLTVVVNNFISLTCEVTGFPPPDLNWLKNGKPISLNTNALIVPGGRTLQIPRAKLSDGGEYTCIARNQAGESKKRSFLTVYVPPSIKDHTGASLAVVNVRVGALVALECESNAVPPPIITWYKNGRMITESENMKILADGQMLQIKSAEVSDTGQYVCKAINIAGRDDKNFHLNVYVPPSIQGPEQEWINETISNPVTFACDATGIPPPTLIWLKNGKSIENSDSLEVHILSGGSKLQIARSQQLDSGTYTCVASNVEGKAQKSYILSVQVPPHIAGSEMPSDVSILLGESFQLVCNANGIPTPVLQWLKDGKPVPSNESQRIRVTPDGSTLNILRALTMDVGKYTCVATNPAGEEDRIFNLNVYVPPAILNNKVEPEELTALLDTSVNIECTATGTPPPQINWLKNGLPLSVSSQIRLLSAGQILRIVRAHLSDVGVYTCVASNRAGVDNKHYSLQVYVPPSMDNAGGTEEVIIVKGNTASIMCLSDGIPTPKMSWIKNGQALSLGPNMTISNQGMVFHIAKTEIDDTGRYTCTAANEAGEVSKHFTLKVLDPPHINGSDQSEEISVVVNNPLELHCISSGIPVPKITWMKDGRLLPQNENVHVLRGGEVLRIASAQVEDTGRYTCLASSPAGDDDKEYLVRVHVPPNIAGTSDSQDVTVLQNRQVILECKSDAVPPPTITWLKNGALLQGTPRVRILSSGRYLQINNADLGDAATYTCVASNIAGKTTREFVLTVNVAPIIRTGPQTVVVLINTSAVLKCDAEGVPTPRITWRKDGAIFSGNNARYSVLEDGSLSIHSAHITDSGRYLCMATNAAGTERKRIDLQVHVPPSIAPGPTNITVTVNVQTTLPCETTGIPRPVINWKKNGHLLNVDQNQNTYRLLSSGSLVIISPTVDDTAVYECAVSNEAGEDQRAVDLIVQVPPSIADEATDLLVTKLSPAVISCTASGVPAPSVHWTKNGIRLLPRGDGYRILSSGAIEMAAAQLNHAGRYTCVARNAAGSAHRHVTLHVHEPPTIQTQPGTLDVILNNPALLPCEAIGTPRPIITWQKEGINIITTGNSYTILPSGSLQIARAIIGDAGTYMCVAQNSAGTALGKIKLKVQVPPVIKSHPKEYIITVDKSATLQCEADGYPAPEITWHKDGEQIPESIRQRILSTGALQIAFVQPDDTGRYTCMAANVAGSSSSSMELIVYIPPKIRSTEANYIATENFQAVLSCVADGIPTPAIKWKKDNITLMDRVGKHRTVPYGDLILDNVVPEDSGSYTCVASNAAGEDAHTVKLMVHVLPAFTELPGDIALNKGELLRLTCKATGTPVPKITWTFNNNIIPALYDTMNGHSELVIERVSKEDSGTYVCTADNTVGSVKAIGFVYVKEPPVFKGDYHSSRIEPLGGNAILNCEVLGDPPVTIQWRKRGVGIQISDRIRQLSNGSLAIYGTVNEDAGDYKCVATNDAGVGERSMTLTLQSPPVITVEPVDTIIDAGTTAVLNCQANGEPLPTIEWSRQGHPILSDDRVTVLSNGSLRIVAAQKEDTSEYECIARNLMGSVLVRVPFTVQVHGGYSDWLEWRPCSVTCGQGVQKRIRQCNNPLPANGGRPCQGPDTDIRSCQNKPCPVDGNWSEWGSWEECSKTCGQGNRTRTRTCSNPSGQHGGKPCEGNAVESIMCNVRPCPVDGEWDSWLPWGPCSETCGKGTQTRLRLCNNPPPAFGGSYCDGPDTQLQVCNKKLCPVDGKWALWASWTACTVSCGGGTRQRTRDCSDPAPQFGGHKCEGSDVQIDFCNSDPCPIHGNWGPWSNWGTCSRTCNGGQMRRYRTCDNPHPVNGGRACAGADTQIQRCNTGVCPVDGNWGPWQAWSGCSAPCRGGEQTRTRLCNNPTPSNSGRPCPGDSSQVSRCNIQACPGGPSRARGSVIGNINDVEFGIAFLNATVTDSTDSRMIQAKITNVPRSLGPAMKKLVSILNPIYWTSAKEIGEAVNGFTLTNAIFKRETQVEFATGEILRMTHTARGLDSDGALLLDVVVSGYVLQLQSSADVNVKDYTEDYIQTGPGQLYAYSTRLFTIDGVSVPYMWNHTITYDHTRGKMPFLVETLHASSIITEYNPLEETLDFKIHASITKGDRSNQCPGGFSLDSSGPYCSDEDECAVQNPCSHVCHNAIGTYYCSCPKGLTISADGRTCHDIDECALGGHSCHAGQDCENIIGSYRCVVRCGIGFKRTSDGLSCQDVNECQESNSCHQHCFNTIGSFHCGCDPGYQLKGRKCMDINECRQNVCRPDQHCKNTRGGYKCIDLCPNGMTKADNGTCIDIDECRDGTHQCRYNQICENTRGSHRCGCPRGYRSQGIGRPCVDINECEQAPKPCAVQCTNTPGSFKCGCPPGQHLLGDGKSCAGLERLPDYGAYYSSYNYAQISPVRDIYQPQQYYRHSSNLYSSYSEYRNSRIPFSRTKRNIRETCPEGYEARNDKCIDIDECETRDACQHECRNTLGSYHCVCPIGYRLMINGKTCQDVDECLEQNIHCGSNRMCFNMRGSYQCIDTPCPPNYQRDPLSGFCLKNCPPNDLECALSPYALEYKLVSLPFGIAANQDLIRLVAYTQDQVMHPRTTFLMVDEDPTIPFALRDENLKGVVFTTRPLREPETYRMRVRALSYSTNGSIEYQTTFIVYIAVSAYPY